MSTIDSDDSATILQWRPETDDTGYLAIGDGTKDMDVKLFLNAATKYALFDVGNAYLTLEDSDLRLGDNDELQFGDGAAGSGGDVRMTWNATKLVMLPLVNDTGYFAIGDGTTDFDVWVTLGNATKYVLFDVGNDYLTLSNVNLKVADILTAASPTAGVLYMVAGTRAVHVS